MRQNIVTLNWRAADHWDGRRVTSKPENILNEWKRNNPDVKIHSIDRSDSGDVVANYRTAFTIVFSGQAG